MIEERAIVVEATAAFAVVETLRQSVCDGCRVNTGCGTATIAKVLGKRRTRVRALAPIPLSAGDEVIVGIGEEALLRGSAVVYLVPLLGLFLGGGVGKSAFGGAGEEMSILLGIVGFVAGALWLSRYFKRTQGDARFQPIVLRRVGGTRS